MKKNMTSVLFLLLLLIVPAFSATPAGEKLSASTDNLVHNKPLLFIENKGQVTDIDGNPRPDVLYTAEGNGIRLFITRTGILYRFEKNERTTGGKEPAEDLHDLYDREKEQITTTHYFLQMSLAGASGQAEAFPESLNPYCENYYNVPAYPDGIRGIRSFEKIRIKNVYPNIDWVLYTGKDGLKYDFLVHPGGNPGRIKLKYDGAKVIDLQADGSLRISTPFGTIEEQAPYTYQSVKNTQKEVSAAWKKLSDGTIGFRLAAFNSSAALIIDPSLNWTVNYGGSGDEYGYSVTTDRDNNVYLSGETNSSSGIASGGFQNTRRGGYDAFLVKFNSSGERLWATYYGGAGGDYAYSVTTDAASNVYLAGYTGSSSDISNGGFQNTYGGGNNDAFLVKFNNAGERLWATYYGGTGNDRVYSVATDATDNVYLAGQTSSSSGIAYEGFQNTLNGGNDAFLVKFNGAGERIWATYYGGEGGEFGYSIAIDAANNIYLGGYTSSTSGIAYEGFQNTLNAGVPLYPDAFLVKFSSTGERLWATYYGGTGTDECYSVATDAADNVYLAGYTASTSGIANGGFQNTFGGWYDAFLVKFNSTGERLWATYYGKGSNERGRALAIDAADNVYLAGTTPGSSDPSHHIASGGFQNTPAGNDDAFLVKFNSSGERQWATYYGSALMNICYSVAADAANTVYLAGRSYGLIAGGGTSNEVAFLASINTCTTPVSPAVFNNARLCNSLPVTLRITNPVPEYNYVWNTGDTTLSIVVDTPGTYSVTGAFLSCPPQGGSVVVDNNPDCGGFLEIESDTAVNYFDTITVRVKIRGAANIFSVYAQMSFNSTRMKLIESIPGDFLGANVISTPPVITGDNIDFGISKTSGQAGSNGSGIFYTFRFVLTNLPPETDVGFNPLNPGFSVTTYTLRNLSVYNALGVQPPSFNDLSVTEAHTKINYYVPVWPGDLNNDYTVNVADLLPIGYFYNSTGPVRPNGSLFWAAQPAQLWGFNKTARNSNAYKTFADGNADGVINLADQASIGFNLNKRHARMDREYQFISGYTPRQKTDNAPPLKVAIPQDTLSDFPGSVNATLTLGSSSQVAVGVYGLAFDLYFDASCVQTSGITINFSNVFGTLNTDYTRIVDSTQVSQGRISFGFTRFNTSALNFNGNQILSVNFPLTQSCVDSECFFKVAPHVLSCNKSDGSLISLYEEPDSAYACDRTVGIEPGNDRDGKFLVFPNPADNTVTIRLERQLLGEAIIRLKDISGKTVMAQPFSFTDSVRSTSLDLAGIEKGIYLIEIQIGPYRLHGKVVRI